MKIMHALALPNFQLELQFDNGERGIVDVSSFAGKGVFAAWNTPDAFESVSVSNEGAVEWPGEIDLCPDALYLRMTGKKPDDVEEIADA
jgi:hypothetical protein